MDSLLFLFIFALFGLTLFILGALASRKITSRSDYFLAGRDLGLASVTFTLIAIQLGGNMVLGAAQWAYTYGAYGILYALGMSLGFLLLASGFAARLRSCNVTTTAELFEKKYSSPVLRKFAALISIISLLGILVSIVVSSRTLIQGLGIHYESVFILFWCIIISYIMLGGMHAVVLTDIAQVLFIILCIGAVFVYSIVTNPQGFIPLHDLLNHQSEFATHAINPATMLAAFLMPAFFALIEQDLAQALFSARSQGIALMSAFLAGIFIIAFGSIPVYFGMQARLINLPLIADGNPFIAVTEHITSPFMFALIVCSIIAAITSTANSLVCAVSANIVQDFLPTLRSEKAMVRLSQWMTLATGVVAVLASYFMHKTIIEIAISSYEISVCCLLIPLVCALYTKHPNKNAAFLAAFFGLIGFIGFRVYPVSLPKEILTLIISALGYFTGNCLLRT